MRMAACRVSNASISERQLLPRHANRKSLIAIPRAVCVVLDSVYCQLTAFQDQTVLEKVAVFAGSR